jgi:formylglycine-generating enzyme required for sulfatase activity
VAWDGISNEDSQTESAACGAYMSDHDDHPINCVSWTQATAFCATQGKRLPTEAEWEYAAGSGAEHRRYSWGDSPPSSTLLNACGAECSTWFAARGRKLAPMYPGDDGFRITAPAGTFPAGDTAHGLHDMIGNVWEWTSSPYCVYPAHECQSPHKVFRGGGFATASAVNARASSRLYSNPEHRYMDVGFRCVKAPTP